jgi:hypothetical protein
VFPQVSARAALCKWRSRLGALNPPITRASRSSRSATASRSSSQIGVNVGCHSCLAPCYTRSTCCCRFVDLGYSKWVAVGAATW